jgi:hypothetical protein
VLERARAAGKKVRKRNNPTSNLSNRIGQGGEEREKDVLLAFTRCSGEIEYRYAEWRITFLKG